MSKSQKRTPEPPPQQRSLFATVGTGLMILLAIGIVGSLWRMQSQTGANPTPTPGSNTPQNRQDPTLIQPDRDAAIAKAKMLRSKWQGWALKHKAELKRLQNAPAADRVALMAVWKATPTSATASTSGFTAQELSAAPVPFTWQPGTKTQTSQNPKLRDAGLKEMESLQKVFGNGRDIEISRSIMPGSSEFILWASGRITETKTIPNPGSGKSAFIEAPPVEIAPPYDFLK